MKAKAVIVLALLLMSECAYAAPFCAVYSSGRRCWYYSMESCQQANPGDCVINEGEMHGPVGTAPFCVVSSYAARCYYYSAQSCRDAAARDGGACVYNR